MDRAELAELLTTGVVDVTFRKADNSIREMRATLMDDMLPQTKGVGRNSDPEQVQIVFDVDKRAWRSFRYDRLISAEVNGNVL